MKPRHQKFGFLVEFFKKAISQTSFSYILAQTESPVRMVKTSEQWTCTVYCIFVTIYVNCLYLRHWIKNLIYDENLQKSLP